jgi:hypothetical protein
VVGVKNRGAPAVRRREISFPALGGIAYYESASGLNFLFFLLGALRAPSILFTEIIR